MWEQVQRLRARGHECSLLVTAPGWKLKRRTKQGVTVWTAGLRNVYWPLSQRNRNPVARFLWHVFDVYNPLMARQLSKVLSQEKPDVVSIHNQAGWSAALYRTLRRFCVPAVQVLHGHYLLCPKTIMYRRGRNCSKQCGVCKLLRVPHRRVTSELTAVVGVSRYILERHIEHGYFRKVTHRYVIHNATSRGGTRAQMRPREPGAPLRIGFIGRLDPPKGVEYLLKAVKEFKPEDVELWVAGDTSGPYASMLKETYTLPNVHFKGYVTAQDFYPEVDCVVVPSLMNDNLPGVVYEAFCYERPVIGARRGGIPEMIRAGENGYLFEPLQPQSLHRIIRKLVDTPELLTLLSSGAARSAESYADVDGWIEAYIRVYQNAARVENSCLTSHS